MKKLFAGLLFLLLSASLQAQQSVQSNLSSLEEFVMSFENESFLQKILIEDLQKQLGTANQSVENLESQLAEMSELQEKQSKLLRKQELLLKTWKTVATVGIPLTIIITTGIVFTACNSK